MPAARREWWSALATARWCTSHWRTTPCSRRKLAAIHPYSLARQWASWWMAGRLICLPAMERPATAECNDAAEPFIWCLLDLEPMVRGTVHRAVSHGLRVD